MLAGLPATWRTRDHARSGPAPLLVRSRSGDQRHVHNRLLDQRLGVCCFGLIEIAEGTIGAPRPILCQASRNSSVPRGLSFRAQPHCSERSFGKGTESASAILAITSKLDFAGPSRYLRDKSGQSRHRTQAVPASKRAADVSAERSSPGSRANSALRKGTTPGI